MDMGVRVGIFVMLLVIAVLAAPPVGLHGEERVHVVERGETLYSIARSHGITADNLMRHNGISDPSRLQVGQRLRIPGSGSPAAPAVEYTTYRVVRGDTFFSLTRRFSVTEEAIRRANNLSDGYILLEGVTLRIPLAPGGTGQLPPAEATPPVVTTPPATGTGVLDTSVRWPIVARELSQMTGRLSGVVITGVRGESVRSLTRGTVLSAGPYRGFGRVVIVQVEGGYLYVYGGCESLSVKEGDTVGPGTELGRLGIDAASEKPQLFFMVYHSNVPIDPAKAPRA